MFIGVDPINSYDFGADCQLLFFFFSFTRKNHIVQFSALSLSTFINFNHKMKVLVHENIARNGLHSSLWDIVLIMERTLVP